MVWKVVKSAQPPVRYRPNSDRRPDIVCMRESRAAKSQICQGPSFFVVTCPAAARAGAPGPGVGALMHVRPRGLR